MPSGLLTKAWASVVIGFGTVCTVYSVANAIPAIEQKKKISRFFILSVLNPLLGYCLVIRTI
jgi:hypothetical protein